MKENQFQAKIVKMLKDKGCFIFNIHGERMQKKGIPDLLVIGLKWKGFLELKVGKNQCTEIQKKQMEEIEKRDFPVYVLRWDVKYKAIYIENRIGEKLNLVYLDGLWYWLKHPLIDEDLRQHYIRGKRCPNLIVDKMEKEMEKIMKNRTDGKVKNLIVDKKTKIEKMKRKLLKKEQDEKKLMQYFEQRLKELKND